MKTTSYIERRSTTWRDLPIDLISRSAISHWAPVPLRLIVGYGFVSHPIRCGAGTPSACRIAGNASRPLASLAKPCSMTILVEILGGLAVLLGALVPLTSIPMATVLLVAVFTVHLPYGFSSIRSPLPCVPCGPCLGRLRTVSDRWSFGKAQRTRASFVARRSRPRAAMEREQLTASRRKSPAPVYGFTARVVRINTERCRGFAGTGWRHARWRGR
jgi:uncharacterized membrane protein YphA (DoxX/SURF4 family)